MIASHGRTRRTGRTWLLTALAASGIHVVFGSNHMVLGSSTSSHAVRPAGSEATELPDSDKPNKPAPPTPASYLPPVTPEPILAATTPTSAPVAPAVQVLPTTAPPTVANWHDAQPPACTPPPPPPPCVGSPSPANHTHVTPPIAPPMNPLTPPAALQVLPAPEPSTIVTAFALAGAFAWVRSRRPAVRSRD